MDAPIEFRFAELRQTGERSVSGTVVRYDDVASIAGTFHERIMPGAFTAQDTILNLQHDRAKPLARMGEGGSLQFVASPGKLEVRAEIVNTPTGNDALALIEARILRGFSVEMTVKRDRWQRAGELPLRTIESALLRGVALVDRPAYPKSSVNRAQEISFKDKCKRVTYYYL